MGGGMFFPTRGPTLFTLTLAMVAASLLGTPTAAQAASTCIQDGDGSFLKEI